MDHPIGTRLNTNFCNFNRIGSISATPYSPHCTFTISGSSGEQSLASSGSSGISGIPPSGTAAKVRQHSTRLNPRNYSAADKQSRGPTGGITKNRYAPPYRHLQFPEIAGSICGNCGDLPYNKSAKLKRARYIGRIFRWSTTCKNTQCFPSKKLPKL